MMFGNAMYLRPGNLWKNFRVLKMHVDNVDGYAKNSYEDTGTIVDGILAQATSNERELTKHLWDQKLHSLTHAVAKCISRIIQSLYRPAVRTYSFPVHSGHSRPA